LIAPFEANVKRRAPSISRQTGPKSATGAESSPQAGRFTRVARRDNQQNSKPREPFNPMARDNPSDRSLRQTVRGFSVSTVCPVRRVQGPTRRD
ncbi:hypothetical protein CGCVW01_v003222, partial [Colletotrichum viniferum]